MGGRGPQKPGRQMRRMGAEDPSAIRNQSSSSSDEIHLAVDGSGMARPWAGVGTYTREMVTAMVATRPVASLTVYAPPGVEAGLPGVVMQQTPSARLVGRHLLWPLQLRGSRARAYFGPAGSLPLVGAGLPSVVTAHDM